MITDFFKKLREVCIVGQFRLNGREVQKFSFICGGNGLAWPPENYTKQCGPTFGIVTSTGTSHSCRPTHYYVDIQNKSNTTRQYFLITSKQIINTINYVKIIQVSKK